MIVADLYGSVNEDGKTKEIFSLVIGKGPSFDRLDFRKSFEQSGVMSSFSRCPCRRAQALFAQWLFKRSSAFLVETGALIDAIEIHNEC